MQQSVAERMQQDWNERAREDAHFYVAFGRRDQDPEEFFATAKEIAASLEMELRRFPASANRRAWRALEIGCGPGRLMRPLSRNFGEIHGIDVSDEMIRRAAANLRDIPHAHVRHTTGSDLAPFADDSFEFIYSYAVFQHIPSREVVMQYLREARRVLTPGGFLRAQINGLDPDAGGYDTWSGVRISADEIREFARANDLQLLALEGARTQYMWVTMRKRAPGWNRAAPSGLPSIRRITNAHNSEPVAPSSGRFASITVWVEFLPAVCDLDNLTVTVGGEAATPCYIGPPEADGLQQLNVLLPKLPRTGLLPVQLWWNDRPLCSPRLLRVIPPGPRVPLLVSVNDGIDIMSGKRIVTRTVKATVEEASEPSSVHAVISGEPLTVLGAFCIDPRLPSYEVNFRVPDSVPPGHHSLDIMLQEKLLGRIAVEIA